MIYPPRKRPKGALMTYEQRVAHNHRVTALKREIAKRRTDQPRRIPRLGQVWVSSGRKPRPDPDPHSCWWYARTYNPNAIERTEL